MTRSSWVKQLMVLGLFAAGLVIPASSTPVHPSMKELLSQPAPEQRPAPAARVGWNGPEMEGPSEVEGLAGASPAQADREAKASLRQVATPDWEAVLGIAAFIVLLRVLRKRGERYALAEATSVSAGDSNSEPNAMRPAA